MSEMKVIPFSTISFPFYGFDRYGSLRAIQNPEQLAYFAKHTYRDSKIAVFRNAEGLRARAEQLASALPSTGVGNDVYIEYSLKIHQYLTAADAIETGLVEVQSTVLSPQEIATDRRMAAMLEQIHQALARDSNGGRSELRELTSVPEFMIPSVALDARSLRALERRVEFLD